MTVDYEKLRARHAHRPLQHLREEELTALVALAGTVQGPLRDMAFLAVCEKQSRLPRGGRPPFPRKDAR